MSLHKRTARHPNTQRVDLIIVSTDQDVLERFARIVDCGSISKSSTNAQSWKPHWKPQWRWRCGKQADCERVLELMLEHFGVRRKAKALECLAAIRAPRPDRSAQAKQAISKRQRDKKGKLV